MFNTLKKAVFFTNYYTVIIAFLVFSFLLDFIDKIEIFYSIDFIKYNRILKLFLFLYSLLFIIINYKYIINRLKYWCISVTILGLLMVLKMGFWDAYLNEFLRYIFIFITYPLIHFTFLKNQGNIVFKFYNILKYFIIVNTMAVLAGLLFDILVFQTYSAGRFGYNGLLLSQGLTPYVYLSATVLFWTKKEKKMLFLVFMLSLLSGIKGVYFAEISLLIFLILFDTRFSSAYKIKVVFALTTVFALLILGLFQLHPFKEVLESRGFFSAVFSLRNEYFFELLKTMNNDNFNVFIGAIGLEKVRLELQIIDIFLFFGSFGLIVFIYFLHNFYKETILNFQSKSFFISAILLSIFAGNLLYIPFSSILFFSTIFCLKYYEILTNLKTN